MPRLRDVICSEPRILFVGINPGKTSGKLGHHFAGPGNPFWQLLHAARLTPHVLDASNDATLADYRYALTNLCPRPTSMASELTSLELERGRKQLVAKIQAMRPWVIALVGVTLYPVIFGKGGDPGPGEKTDVLGGGRVFVVPNPSGLNASFPTFADKAPWFVKLRELAESLTTRPAQDTEPRATRKPRGAK